MTTKKFTDLQNEGAVAVTVSPTALFLIVQGGQSQVVTYQTLYDLFVPTPPPVNTVSPVTIAAGGGTVVIPAGKMIVAVTLLPTANGTLRIGTSSGGDKIINYDYLLADGRQIVNFNYDFDSDTTIYISPTTASTKIYFV